MNRRKSINRITSIIVTIAVLMSCGGYLFADEIEETEVVPEEPIAEETEDVSEAEVIIEDDSYVYELAEEPDVTDLSEDAEIEEIAEAIDDIGFLTADGVEINEDNFPDDVFREYVLENCDADHDGMLSEDEINGITSMYINRSIVYVVLMFVFSFLIEKVALKNSDNDIVTPIESE